MDLPRRAVVWSLVSFDIGALVAAAGLLAALTVALEYLRPRLRGSVLIRIGSSVVALGGVYLFVQRVFFPAGLL
jgi:hypothetical protein